MERENQHFEQSSSRSNYDESFDNRKGKEQESSYDFHSLHPVATPTRAQQQRHRRNLRLNGQVDVEKGSLPRHTLKDDRRDSWIDRINSSTKDAIRRSSYVIATVDEKKLIDKVADSINEYGDQHKDDSWADKVMNFLFPSMGLISSPANKSDEKKTNKSFDRQIPSRMSPSDQIQCNQHKDDRTSWPTNATDAKNKKNKNPQAFYTNNQTNRKSYADATQNGHHRSSSSSSTSSWSLFSDNNHEEQKLDLDNESQWPPL